MNSIQHPLTLCNQLNEALQFLRMYFHAQVIHVGYEFSPICLSSHASPRELIFMTTENTGWTFPPIISSDDARRHDKVATILVNVAYSAIIEAIIGVAGAPHDVPLNLGRIFQRRTNVTTHQSVANTTGELKQSISFPLQYEWLQNC